jgi:hypothetical protein
MEKIKFHRCPRWRWLDRTNFGSRTHAQTTTLQNDQPKIVQGGDQPNRVSIEYVAPQNPELQELYGLLRERDIDPKN